MHPAVFVGLSFATGTYLPSCRQWPLIWLIPLLGYFALVGMIPPLRTSFRPWRFGTVSKTTVFATLIITLGSCAILAAFHLLTKPDVSHFGKLLPVHALGGIVVAGILFSLFNAIFEEVVFRGIFFDACAAQRGSVFAITVTSVIFGYGHMQGYPPGVLGAFLAGIYAVCLGWLRVYSGGLGLPILAHVAADATIYILVTKEGVFAAG